MKILQIHNFYKTPGGECSVVNSEKKLLEKYGHSVVRFSKYSNDIDSYSIIRNALAFIQIPYNLTIFREFSRYIRAQRPDVAHVHNIFPLISPSVYSILKYYRVPVAQTIHNYRFLCPNGLLFTHGKVCEECGNSGYFSAVKKKCMHDSTATSLSYAAAIAFGWKTKNFISNIDCFIALNNFSAQMLINRGIPHNKISICCNFIETFKEPASLKSPYVLYLGRLSSEKGILTLLKALKKVKGIVLRIAGSGPQRKVLENYAEKHLKGRVEFMGHISGNEKVDCIQNAICSVTPSEWYENFPISIVESLGYGTPVIASRLGGLPEIIDHGKTGFLFQPGNASELSAYINQMANKKDTAENMGFQAFSKARNDFGPSVHYNNLMNIYNNAINANA